MSRLLDKTREKILLKQYSHKTASAYVSWCKKYILFHNKQHPDKMGKKEVEQFLTHLAIEKNVSSSTQNQAFSALLFFYRHVLNKPLKNIDAIRAKRRQFIPTVLSQREVETIICNIDNQEINLIVQMMYGGGLRLMEVLRCRVQNIDFDRNLIQVIDSKHGGSRVTLLPPVLHPQIKRQIEYVDSVRLLDMKNEQSMGVSLPNNIGKKYPNANYDLNWQYLFPAKKLSTTPETNSPSLFRHHLYHTAIQRMVRQIAKDIGITKRVTPHTFRHTFATHMIEHGVDISIVQKLMGHKDIKTTRQYIHLAESPQVKSPLEYLFREDH